ncbi:hypothetical protein PN36_26875 [Candidatus Thiomargarita nelsonii]|uniref:Calx-beta domain-containing protein n=1 Tax=Candidatus Thiomargarita nelsonii TaxID=1003181 RepID=A0A4E0QM56_9GAMM|nr:hypothetical protein PN36_26875 [Candidatus Thiomargarita nelsonii]
MQKNELKTGVYLERGLLHAKKQPTHKGSVLSRGIGLVFPLLISSSLYALPTQPTGCALIDVDLVEDAVVGTTFSPAEYRLTPESGYQVGAIWGTAPVDLDQPFDIQHYVYLGTRDSNGADGIAFVLRPSTAPNIGDVGGGIGYGGISPSVAVEFDTWENSHDPVDDHTAIVKDGDTYHDGDPATQLTSPITLGNIEDGFYHLMRFVWDPSANTLTYFYDDGLITTLNRDIRTDLGTSEVLWGYTGSTGAAINEQKVCALSSHLSTLDYGDAPDSYGTLTLSNGPSHVINADMFLGNEIDDETDGQPTAVADGDDNNGSVPDDEDGATFPVITIPAGESYTVNVSATNNLTTDATVAVWIDWDQDGSFTDETPVSNILSANSSFNNEPFVFTVPIEFVHGTDTYARVRISTNLGSPVSPVGVAPDGEVEDYYIPADVTLAEVQFSSATYSVTENGGQATITVTRTGGSQGAISANYATSDDTATAGSDYTAASGTLNWADGDATDKTFTIDITDDTAQESNETLLVSLGNPTGSAQLGEPDTTVVTITDNDNAQPGTPQFTNSTFMVAETASTVTLTVRRVGGTNGELTVNYATTDGTATDGSDYIGAIGTLTWADGDSNDKTFTVTITDDSLSEGNETFTVSLESLDSAIVTITDNDTTLVTLVDFTATALENSIEIAWITNTEFDSIGFHLWRATGEGWKNGDYSTVTRLTEQLIPAEGNSGAGATYSYIDSDVESGITYYYGLEDIDLTGHSTFYWDYIDSATAK